MKTVLLIVRRFAAFAIDWLLFGIGSLPIVLYFWFGGVDQTAETRIQTVLLWAWLIYFAVFEWVYGATIGKFMCRLLVKRTDGTRLSLWTAVSRTGLTFVIPCVLSVFVIPGILLNSTNFAEHVAIVISTAVLAAIPLSVAVFEGQGVADVLLHTCVTPVATTARTTPVTTKRWLLVGLLSLLVGIGFSWMAGFSYRMMYGADDMNKSSHTFVNTFPPDLIGSDKLVLGDERKMMMDIRGNFIRQPNRQKAEPFDKNLSINLYGSSTSYDELLVIRRVTSDMAELPDAERPKCLTVKFVKEFDAVLTSFQQQHEMTVCDVPKGLPYQATLIDHNLGASWQFKLNEANMLRLLMGQSGDDIRRLVPRNTK